MRKDSEDRNEWLPIADPTAQGPEAIIKLFIQRRTALEQGMGF